MPGSGEAARQAGKFENRIAVGEEDMGKLSLATWIYVLALVAAATAVLVRVPVGLVSVRWWIAYAVLALVFLIFESTPVFLASRGSAWSPSSASTLAAVVLLGPIGAAMVGAAAVLSFSRRIPVVERLFNGSMYAVAGFAAGVVYAVAGIEGKLPAAELFGLLTRSHLSVPRPAIFAGLIVPFVAAAMAHVLVNHGLVVGMLMLDKNTRSLPPGGAGSSVPLLLSDLGF